MKIVERTKALIQAAANVLGYEIHRKGITTFNRMSLADMYIKGNGIEIGALNAPLQVPPAARVKYVDRFSVPELRKHYPELSSTDLVNVDIIDDGELLETVDDMSQDFVIANHFLEHCQDPIRALCSMFRVLRCNGILYLAIPDKRFTFDSDRPVTSTNHILEDFKNGGVGSKRAAFEEWVRYVGKVKDEAEAAKQISKLMHDNYSIHYHAWTPVEIMEIVLTLRKEIGLEFELELFHKFGIEVVVVLRKTK